MEEGCRFTTLLGITSWKPGFMFRKTFAFFSLSNHESACAYSNYISVETSTHKPNMYKTRLYKCEVIAILCNIADKRFDTRVELHVAVKKRNFSESFVTLRTFMLLFIITLIWKKHYLIHKEIFVTFADCCFVSFFPSLMSAGGEISSSSSPAGPESVTKLASPDMELGKVTVGIFCSENCVTWMRWHTPDP